MANLRRPALVPKRDSRWRGGEGSDREGSWVGRGDGNTGRDGGVEGAGQGFVRLKRRRKTKLFTFFCLFVCFAFVKGDKQREGLLTATTYL